MSSTSNSIQLTVETGESLVAGDLITINSNGKAEKVTTDFSGDIDGVAQTTLTGGDVSNFLQQGPYSFTGLVDTTYNEVINAGDPVSAIIDGNGDFRLVANISAPIGLALNGLTSGTGPINVNLDLPNEVPEKVRIARTMAKTNFLWGDGLWPLKNIVERDAQAIVTQNGTSGAVVDISDYFGLIDGVFIGGRKKVKRLDFDQPAHEYTITTPGPAIVCIAIQPSTNNNDNDSEEKDHIHAKGKIVEDTVPFGDGYINIATVELDANGDIIDIQDKRDFICDITTVKDLINEGPTTAPVVGNLQDIESEVLKLTLAVRDLVFQNNLKDFQINNPTYKDKVLRNFLDNSNIDFTNSANINYNPTNQSVDLNRPSPGRVVYFNPDTEKIEDRRVVSGELVWDLDVSQTATDPLLQIAPNVSQIKAYKMIDGRYLISYDTISGSNPNAKVLIINDVTKAVDFAYQPVGISASKNQVVMDAIEEITYTGGDPTTAVATGNIIIAGGRNDSRVYAIDTGANPVVQWQVGNSASFGTQNGMAHGQVFLPKSVDNTTDNHILVLDANAIKVYDKTTGDIIRTYGTPSSGCIPDNGVGIWSHNAIELKATTDALLTAGTERGLVNSNSFFGANFFDGTSVGTQTINGVPATVTKYGNSIYRIGGYTFKTTSGSSSDIYTKLTELTNVDEANDGHFVAYLTRADATGTGPTAQVTPAGIQYVDMVAESRAWTKDFTTSGSSSNFYANHTNHAWRNVDWVNDLVTLTQTGVIRDVAFTAPGVTNVTNILLESNTNLKGDSSVSYKASNDNGVTFETITPGTEHTFTSTGNKVIVEATLDRGTVTVPTDLPSILDWAYLWKGV